MNTKMNASVVAFRDRTVVPALAVSANDPFVGTGVPAGTGSAGTQTKQTSLGKASPTFGSS